MSRHAMEAATLTPEISIGKPAEPRSKIETVAALRKIAALQGLTDEEYGWLAENGVDREAVAGDVLFHEGQPAVAMSILLHGEIHVRRERGGSIPLFIGRAGHITGLLPFSRMKTYGGVGMAVGDVRALVIHKTLFADMLAAIPSMTQVCISMLLDRVREITRMEQQSEKLNALGKLAGNLAHELNNPASAAQRAASGMLSELRIYGQTKYELGAICLTPEQLSPARAWQLEIQSRPRTTESAATALREESLTQWFHTHLPGKDAWRMTPELSECSVEVSDLDRLHAVLGNSSTEVVLRQFASSLRAERMTEAMLDATARIFDLIAAIKDYSYMDQAPIQEIDVAQGLDSTLAMLPSRLAGIEIVREYAPGLPCISAYGSELNQVWMALLENAIDAIEESGRQDGQITIRASVTGPLMLVEIWDNGCGVPEPLHDRVFEPFFTTKAPGSGLGLGLDMAQRIVRKHRGFVQLQSKPEATCFQVRLPIEQIQAY
jgi:signal transduction histidine kinase